MEKLEYNERLATVRATVDSVSPRLEAVNEAHPGFLGQMHPERLQVAWSCIKDLGGCAIELVRLVPHITKVSRETEQQS